MWNLYKVNIEEITTASRFCLREASLEYKKRFFYCITTGNEQFMCLKSLFWTIWKTTEKLPPAWAWVIFRVICWPQSLCYICNIITFCVIPSQLIRISHTKGFYRTKFLTNFNFSENACPLRVVADFRNATLIEKISAHLVPWNVCKNF